MTDYPMSEAAPAWQELFHPLHRMLFQLRMLNFGDIAELRLLVPEDFPPPYPGVTEPVAWLFGVRVEYTSAVTAPVLGQVLIGEPGAADCALANARASQPTS